MNLVFELLVATGMVALTVGIHLVGIALLLTVLRHHRARSQPTGSVVRDGIGIIGAAIGLFVLHAIEIWSYAALYSVTRALPDFESALYFSTSTYATIGYGDIVLDRSWRIIGAIEGANGVILLGWSTAFFVAVVGRIRFVEGEIGTFR
ncbi:two pore domain potassium channel family protein [Sphingomonas glacialis]|uniref:Two pore domain potassium channel family protein n=1 Tax=Sphingomonas glacialis TaxID=658225 RepID=A0A502G021_9SPHN|nr:potassium channel family protein [Sphingomonas glacialis]TPG55247.1 two pore domain potassium channel family protein [Sphingomonas glacialis]